MAGERRRPRESATVLPSTPCDPALIILGCAGPPTSKPRRTSRRPCTRLGPMKGFARISVAVPSCQVGDVESNARATLSLWRQAADQGSHVVVFPELGLSSYTARDLFFDRHLLDGCESALGWLADASRALAPL